MGKFWEGLGGKLADRWAAVAVPALIFWLGGALAWVRHRDGWDALRAPIAWLGRQPVGAQAVIVVGALLAVAASGVLVDRTTGRVLTLLEGYWPGVLRPVRRRLVGRVAVRSERDEEEFQALAGPVEEGRADADQRDRYARLSLRMRRRPGPDRLLPTHVGNVLRAAETRPIDKYGLDAVALWPHLWLLLPDAARAELTAARRSLDGSVAAVTWGVLFLAFTPWAWWAPPVGLSVAAGAVLVWVPARAEVFAGLIEATFDLYRTLLYQQLRWPLPANPADERAAGRRVTTYVMRGLSGTNPVFTRPEEKPAR